ncbi:MAG TPA: helix-turn-helix domain-containing protein [Terriglobales bacterium]|nr:helix-turn-helix domain-containing protein [Terriglobales bacterium]
MPKRPKMISLREAAEIIGCSDDTARRLAHANELEWFTLRDRGWMLVSRVSVDRFLARRAKHNGAGKPGKERRCK